MKKLLPCIVGLIAVTGTGMLLALVDQEVAAEGRAESQPPLAEKKLAVEKPLHDPNPEVRLTAALALAKTQNAAAFPVLIDLLEILPVDKRNQVEELLREWAGE